MDGVQYQQEPVAIIGFAGRLPGGNHSSQKLWEFLKEGGIAPNNVPEDRFHTAGHYDGSLKPGTMRSKGGMFLGDMNLAEFDASFFELSGTEAIAMDPNQRQMLEVVFEALENSGIPLEKLDGAPVACYVGSYASDYRDMQSRDIEDRPADCSIGVGRAIMANRISYFLNIKGPSITIDTACSGSLVGLDLACKSLQIGESEAAIVAASSLFLVPDHVMDVGSVGMVHSKTALCHTFDEDADGYAKAESVNCIILKKLSHAIRDRDPIRGIVRGSSSNSNGRTRGIVGPSSDSQAAAIRTAYANAGIKDLSETSYLECHGTGTQAGDKEEVEAAGKVFAGSRDADCPLHIGSIKSNIGHAEPAAGINGLMKVILSMENGIIPGSPTFVKPNPKIDFARSKVRASRAAIAWPREGDSTRRASINSFGYGGSNAHAIIDQPSETLQCNHVLSYSKTDNTDDFYLEEESKRPFMLVLSANDAVSLQANVKALCDHLSNPRIKVDLEDLAFTLSERRTRLWHRAFVNTRTTEVIEKDFALLKRRSRVPKVSFVFTGQGSQWPQMGKELLDLFPWTRSILEELDNILQSRDTPPTWSLIAELTEPRTGEHLRQAEFSQPLVTALQLCLVEILDSWGIKPCSVVGHSSGEIAAAYAARLLDRTGAILAAYYRGSVAKKCANEPNTEFGMLAVGLAAEDALSFLSPHSGDAFIACFNSPESVTISGKKPTLEMLATKIKDAGHFARLLQVELPYHSVFMETTSEEYLTQLHADRDFQPLPTPSHVPMFSSVTSSRVETSMDARYWKSNMMSPVQFASALKALISADLPDVLIEVGPTSALAAPISQVLKPMSNAEDCLYYPAWSRNTNAGKSLFDVAGHLFAMGSPIDISLINQYNATTARTIVDLPNYSWNHAVKYWHENAASQDWRFKRFVHHDLLGSKIPGTSWHAPTWRKILNLADVPWLRDHKMGPDILIPGAGLVCLALEAMYQKYCAFHNDDSLPLANDLAYRFKNINFTRVIVVEEEKPTTIMLTLTKVSGSENWHEFTVRTVSSGVTHEHCTGRICVQEPLGSDTTPAHHRFGPLNRPQSARLWYKVQHEIGMNFGPAFQLVKNIECVSGMRHCRSTVTLQPASSAWSPQSYYPLHPAVLDACLQTSSAAHAEGERDRLSGIMLPASISDLVINQKARDFSEGLAVAESIYKGQGRTDLAVNWKANVSIYDPESRAPILRCTGITYTRLDAEDKEDPHVFDCAMWRPDISQLTSEQLRKFLHSNDSSELDRVIDLVAFKMPRLRVLEINMDEDDTSSLWLKRGEESIRATCSHYDLMLANANVLVKAKTAHRPPSNVGFHLLAPDKESLGFPSTGSTYDLSIIKTSQMTEAALGGIVHKLRPLLALEALIIIWHPDAQSDIEAPKTPESSPSTDSIDIASEASDGGVNGDSSVSSSSSSPLDSKVFDKNWCRSTLDQLVADRLFISIAEIDTNDSRGDCSSYLCHVPMSNQTNDTSLNIILSSFKATSYHEIVRAALDDLGWSVTITPMDQLASSFDPDSRSVVLVVDELQQDFLAQIQEDEWEQLKQVIMSQAPILWMTQGAQTNSVTHPNRALVHGLFRTIRNESQHSRLTLLDVQHSEDNTTLWAINQVLRSMQQGRTIEAEYAERDGILLVQRVTPDVQVNEFKATKVGNDLLPPIPKRIFESDALIRLQCNKIGTLDSMVWCEITLGDMSLEPGCIEIEIMASGVNFKDVAIIMGIVPGDENRTGCECAGRVRRIGSGTTKHRVGDRVCASINGTYANRVACPEDRACMIPEWMSYEEAATIPLVYVTAMYGLYYLGNLIEGQSVLIHSAAGGVGIAAVQLAIHRKADVFVTAGTDEKREFLIQQYGIPSDHVYSSRDTHFANEIRRVTGGRGCDLILNSLSGELQEESWSLTADGGTFVEIGKRDIIGQHTLNMEPFDRGCAFRGLDIANIKTVPHKLVGRLLDEIFQLLNAGHIQPIRPVTVLGFDEMTVALSSIRDASHMGKILVSRKGPTDTQLPVQPLLKTLRLHAEAAYLIIGGVRGLCGSITTHLAINGARHIIVMSRSGTKDEASTRVVENCAAYGCEIIDAQGDVQDINFVRSVFASTRPRWIAGVIHGAMVLRDRTYETMTHEDFHTALNAKVSGTWNIHQVVQQEQEQPLQFFTMLSSVSGVIGNRGQANYAAANTFLDAFANYRKSLGLRANTVDLGIIEDVGYLADKGDLVESRFDTSQWTPINEGMLRQIINYSIFQQDDTAPINAASSAQLITGIAYPLRSSDSELLSEIRFGHLFNDHLETSLDGQALTENDPIDQAVQALLLMSGSETEPTKLAKAAANLLQTKITKILRLGENPEMGKPLAAYGLDSLSAVELRSWTRQKLKVELSTLDIVNASTLDDLCEKLVSKLPTGEQKNRIHLDGRESNMQ